MEVTVKIFENKMLLTAKENTVTIEAIKPFTTTRLLIGTFMPAVECLKEGLQKIGATGLLKRKPHLIILPQSMTEGGLSEIEERCLMEVGLSAGASKVEVRLY
ncbi:hypothetical protein [Pseudomonas zhanjiangensis]